MSEEKDISILDGAETPSLELLERYLRGEVSDEERELVEQLMVDDPLMADAIEGLRMIEDKKAMRQAIRRIHRGSLIGLDSHIQKRERLSKRQSRVGPKSHWQMYSAVAAAVALLFTTIYLINVMRGPSMSADRMAQNTELAPPPEAPAEDLLRKNERPDADAVPFAADSIDTEEMLDGLLAELEEDNLERVDDEGELLEDVSFSNTDDLNYSYGSSIEGEEEDLFTVPSAEIATANDGVAEELDVSPSPLVTTQPAVAANEPPAPVKSADPVAEAGGAGDAPSDKSLAGSTFLNDTQTSISQEQYDDLVEYENDVALSESPAGRSQKAKDFNYSTAPQQTRAERDESKIARGRMMEELLREARSLYDQKAYLASLTKLEEVLITEPGNIVAYHFRGLNYLALSEKTNAVKAFEKVARASASTFYAGDQWQLAQLYVELGKKAKARRLLRKIIVENGPHAVDAAALLSQIE